MQVATAFKLARILKQRIDVSSDGCSGAPDFGFTKCCVEHDYYYRNPQELTGVSRQEADRRLRKCISDKAGAISWVYWGAVRLFGWIPWNKAGRLAQGGYVKDLHPNKPKQYHKREAANVFKFTDEKMGWEEYDD